MIDNVTLSDEIRQKRKESEEMLKKKKSKGQRIELKVEINMRDGTKLEEFMEKRIIPMSEKYPYMKIHIGVRY